jgi:predicted ATP-grasp superfamily ATP-dependent carboligase
VVRALRARAVETFLVAPRTAGVARSRGVIVLDDGWRIDRSAHSLSAFLGDAGLERGVLLPCDDDWLRVIAELRELGADPFAPAAPPAAIVDTFVDKAAFARTLETLDIDRPRTLEIASPEDLEAVAASQLSSFFLKPRDSQRFTEDFHQKAFRIRDRRHAASQVERALEAGHRLLAQELIPGPPHNHVFVDGFVDRGGRVLGLLARRRLRMYPSMFGNSTDSITIPLTEAKDAVGSILHMFSVIGFHGLFDAEFKRDQRSGRHKLIEVNARPWWQIELARAAGVDVVDMAYREALGMEVEPARRYRIGRRWIHTFPDLRARWATGWWNDHGVSVNESWLSARHAVLDPSDPRPGLAEMARVSRRVQRIVLNRLRDRRSRAPTP